MSSASTKVVLVSGASTGIGRAAVLALADKGFTVLAGVRRLADAPAGGNMEPVLLDVTDQDSIEQAVAAARARGPVAGLVNNAGITVAGPCEALNTDLWRDQFEVNLFGHVTITRSLLPDLLAAGGRIVTVGSVGGRMALPFVAPYCASKFAVRAWTDALRMELAPHGVRVALIEPGAVRTEIWRKGSAQGDAVEAGVSEEVGRRYARQIAGVRKTAARAEKTGVSPEKAATAIVRALTAARPRGHYLVGVDARIQALVAHLPVGASDWATSTLTGTRG